MSLLKGSLGYVKYTLKSQKPKSIEEIEQALSLRKFIPLHPMGEDTESYGFVTFQRPYAHEEKITQDRFLFGDLIALAVRLDTYQYPKALVMDLLYQKTQDHERKMGQPPSFQAKKAMEQAVLSELRGRILPKTKVIEWMWDQKRSEVRCFSQSQALLERFQKLFEQSLQVELQPCTFPQSALEIPLALRERAYLETLAHQPLFPSRHIVDA